MSQENQSRIEVEATLATVKIRDGKVGRIVAWVVLLVLPLITVIVLYKALLSQSDWVLWAVAGLLLVLCVVAGIGLFFGWKYEREIIMLESDLDYLDKRPVVDLGERRPLGFSRGQEEATHAQEIAAKEY